MERKGKSIKSHHHATQSPTQRLAVRARNAHLHLPRRPAFEFEITRGDKVVEKECGHLQGMTEFAATNNHSSDILTGQVVLKESENRILAISKETLWVQRARESAINIGVLSHDSTVLYLVSRKETKWRKQQRCDGRNESRI